jgi:Domain of unknown function (DUF4055)
MPITSVHPSYKANLDRWKRCRDAYEGADAVKGAGQDYLPRLSGQDGTQYGAYVMRALYYGAVGRSIDGFVGAIVRKPPSIKLPAKMVVFEKDTTASGIGLTEFIKKLSCEDLLAGRVGILVDFDENDKRAYLASYTAESITNWGDDFIVLKESAFVQDGSDRFALKEIEQYRELTVEDEIYKVRIWRKKNSDVKGETEDWFVFEEVIPKKFGLTLNEIPFFWLSCFGQSDKIEKPPLLALVDVALSHYRSSADLEHGRHFTALPTLYVTGVSDTTSPIHVGAQAAILLSDPLAKVGYAEFSGQGLSSLERALEEKEHMMAVLGGAVFADQRKGVEAAETARIRTSGETSLLMGVVNSVEETLEAALRKAAEWMNVPMSGDDAIDIAINRDFVDVTLDPQTLTGLLKSYLSGAISLPTFLYNLQQAEMLAPDQTIEKEIAAIKAQPVPGTEGDPANQNII